MASADLIRPFRTPDPDPLLAALKGEIPPKLRDLAKSISRRAQPQINSRAVSFPVMLLLGRMESDAARFADMMEGAKA